MYQLSHLYLTLFQNINCSVMTSLNVNGVQVNFPFEPYPCQVDYMTKVITCLKEVRNDQHCL